MDFFKSLGRAKRRSRHTEEAFHENHGIGKITSFLFQELDGPLSILIGRIEDLQAKCKSRSLTTDYLNQELKALHETARRMVKLHRSLRSIAKSPSRDVRTKVFLGKILDDVLGLIRVRLNQSGIQLVSQMDPYLVVEAKASELGQALFYLLDLAIEALDGLLDGQIVVANFRLQENVRITISHNGRLLSDRKSHNDRHQIELNLELARLLIEAQSGTLSLDPESRQTCFRIDLPLLQLSSSHFLNVAKTTKQD